MSERISKTPGQQTPQKPQVALFVTCLADLFRPSVAFDCIKLLRRAGCEVSVPEQQTCCGQPGYNSGDKRSTVTLAQQFITQFEYADFVVAPSGSCAGMIRRHYPELLSGQWQQRAKALAAKTFELTVFLTEIVKLPSTDLPADIGSISYHDSCAGLRELNIKQQPRQLINSHCRGELKELSNSDVCCGFGGTFCAKMPDISAKMADDKLSAAEQTGAKMLIGGDLGCLLNLAGRASRTGVDLEFRHIAELLAGSLDKPAIGKKS